MSEHSITQILHGIILWLNERIEEPDERTPPVIQLYLAKNKIAKSWFQKQIEKDVKAQSLYDIAITAEEAALIAFGTANPKSMEMTKLLMKDKFDYGSVKPKIDTSFHSTIFERLTKKGKITAEEDPDLFDVLVKEGENEEAEFEEDWLEDDTGN